MASPVFEVYDAGGVLQLNLSSRLTKYLGSVVMTTLTGSITDPRVTQGTPFYILSGTIEFQARRWALPTVTFDNNGLSWTGGSVSGEPESINLIYGIYSNGSN